MAEEEEEDQAHLRRRREEDLFQRGETKFERRRRDEEMERARLRQQRENLRQEEERASPSKGVTHVQHRHQNEESRPVCPDQQVSGQHVVCNVKKLKIECLFSTSARFKALSFLFNSSCDKLKP